MTILQLKYVLAVSACSSMREAAGKLFITQPALSSTIRELEEEINIKIFERTSRGILLTDAGNEFISYAKQVFAGYRILEERYLNKDTDRKHFTVSMQHYVFAVRAFVNTVKKFSEEHYSFSVRETKTNEVLTDVRDLKSEIGVVAWSKNSKAIINKLFREYQLEFVPLMVRDAMVYVGKNHPKANQSEISLDDLKEYPCVSFDQTNDLDFYLQEEALSDREFDKLIKSNDRATSSEIITELDGYSIGTGIMTESVILKDDFVALKLKEKDPLTIGYILRKNHKLSDIGMCYVEELKKYSDK